MNVGYSEIPVHHCQKSKASFMNRSENSEPNFVKLEPNSSCTAEVGGKSLSEQFWKHLNMWFGPIKS